ncbi:MAG: hypothetical protein ACOYOU_16700, partial [Kiritimatiellia bacterium]
DARESFMIESFPVKGSLKVDNGTSPDREGQGRRSRKNLLSYVLTSGTVLARERSVLFMAGTRRAAFEKTEDNT